MAREPANITLLLQQINTTSPELKKAWASFDIARLTEFREKVISLLNQAAEIAEAGAADALSDEGTRRFLDGIVAMERLLNMLDSLTAMRTRVNLNAAMQEISKAGYIVSDPQETTRVESRHLANFEEFKKWKQQTNE